GRFWSYIRANNPDMNDCAPLNTFASFLLLAMLTVTTVHGQQSNVNLDWRPHLNTENLTPFSAPINSPEVRNDRTVTFRLKAPEAKKVSLAGVHILAALGRGREQVPFVKGADGTWTLTVGPLKPDMYVYQVNVDGM